MNKLRRIFQCAWMMLLVSVLNPQLARSETAVHAWVQRYNGTGNNTDSARSVAVGPDNSVTVAGTSLGTSSFDFATVRYSSEGVALWTNRYNGLANGSDSAAAVAVDRNNDAIVTGSALVNTNIQFTTIKYSSEGVPLWTNRFSGAANSNDGAVGIAVTSNNKVTVTGAAGGDVVTIQYSSSGMPLWTNRYNGPSHGLDVPSRIVADSERNLIVIGRSLAGGIGSDFLTIKYSDNGIPLWTNRFNGPAGSIDEAHAVAIDSSNNVIVIGRVSISGYSWGTIKYSPEGSALWTNYFREPTGTAAYPYDVAIDRNNNVFVTGSWYAGLYENLATISYSSSGVPRWTNYYNGPANLADIGRAVKVDDNGNVLVTGYSGGDFATIKYSNAGIPVWTNIYNGPGNDGDSAWAMAMDRNGDFIVCGDSQGIGTASDFTTIKFTSAPAIDSSRMTNGFFEVTLRKPNTVVIEKSFNLSTWTPIFTNTAITNLLLFSDPNNGTFSNSFYRVVRWP